MANYPQNFVNLVNQSSKTMSIVVQIDGISTYLTTGPIYKTIRYGDPGLTYGEPGIVYGGLIERDDFLPYINLSGSMTISQTVEPEQGRGSITLCTISFTDKNGYMSQLMSPGVLVNEPLGNKFVTVYLGMQNSSFPEDYFIVMRGYISSSRYNPAKVDLQLADPNLKRKATICDQPSSVLTGAVNSTQFYFPVAPITGNFYLQITDGAGLYDPTVTTYIYVDSEFIQYGPPYVLVGNIYIQAGVNFQNFYVSLSDAGRLYGGETVRIQNYDGSNPTPYVTITAVNTSTGEVTVSAVLPYVPVQGQILVVPPTENTFFPFDFYSITAGLDDQHFYISSADAANLKVSMSIYIADSSSNRLSSDVIISAITFSGDSAEITLDLPVPFNPGPSQQIIKANDVNMYMLIASGANQSDFNLVSTSDTLRFTIGNYIWVQNQDGTNVSATVQILTFNTGTGVVTTDAPLGYTPTAGQIMVFSAVIGLRGARSTQNVTHNPTASVTNAIQFQDDPISISLKLALSGWDGPYQSGVAIQSIVDTTDPSLGLVANSILLSGEVDAQENLGLNIGDYITISGASNPSNNNTFIITALMDAIGYTNNLIIVNGPLTLENPTSATGALRSQYDTYPILAGNSLAGYEMDVIGLQYIQTNFFSQNIGTMRFLITEGINCKQFTENELYLPVGMYSITRYGRCSGQITKPPISGTTLQVINASNVVDATNLYLERALNTRHYYNEIDYTYDLQDNGTYLTFQAYVNANSLSNVSISTVLPITSDGLKSDLGAQLLVQNQANLLNARYNNVAHDLNLKVNFAVGSQIETGDIVNVQDNGTLNIVNLANGTRNAGSQLFEVINRSMDLKTGQVTLQLLATPGYQVTDRYAVISPSSIVGTGSTTTEIYITDSYGSVLGVGNENQKWTSSVGLPIVVHSPDYSTILGPVTLTGFDPNNPYGLIVSPALGSAPPAGYIVEIDNYSTSTDPLVDQYYKTVYCHIDQSRQVTSGVDMMDFYVSLTDVVVFNVGAFIFIHDTGYDLVSPTVMITNIDYSTGEITVNSSLNFIPASGQIVEQGGFPDFTSGLTTGGPYLLI